MPGRTGRPIGRPKIPNNIPDEVTARDLAAFIGITQIRVQQLAKDDRIPRLARGKYPFAAAVKAYYGLKIDHAAQHQSSSADLLREKRAREIEIKTAQRERDLIPMSEALACADDVTGAFLHSISGLPARMTRNPRERQRLEAICDEERLRLFDRFAKSREVLRSGTASSEAVPEDDAGPVGAEEPRLPANGRRTRSAKA
jgi:hypothetical protein